MNKKELLSQKIKLLKTILKEENLKKAKENKKLSSNNEKNIKK